MTDLEHTLLAAIVFVLCLFAWSYEAQAGFWIEIPIVKEVDCE